MKRLTVSIIGSGNTSWQLAQHFAKSEVTVNTVFTRKPEENQWIQGLGISAEVFDANLTIESDLIFLAVPDDQVSALSSSANLKHKTIIHCSGSVDIAVLDGLGPKGVFYPLQTLTKHRWLPSSQIPVFVEATTLELETQLVDLANSMEFPVEVLSSEKRGQLHLCAVMVNNFTNHLLTKAFQLADGHNLTAEMLMPLAQETLAKFQELGGEKAQTGPAKRKDHSTISGHLESLKGTSMEDLYEAFTQSILKNYD